MLSLAILALAAAVDGRVYLEASPLAERLRPLLIEELGQEALADSAENARFLLILSESEGAVSLALSSTAGAVILDRRIDAGPDQKPALRAATLAIEEAIAAELSLVQSTPVPSTSVAVAEVEEPPLRETAFTSEPPPVRANEMDSFPQKVWFMFAGGAAVSSAKVVPAFEAGAVYQYEAWTFGFSGAGARGEIGTPDLSARMQLYGAFARAGWEPIEAGPFRAGPELAVGALYQHIAAVPVVFEGDAPEASDFRYTLSARPALAVKLAFSRFKVRLAGGVELRTHTLGAALPEGFPIANAELSTDAVSPFALLGLELRPF